MAEKIVVRKVETESKIHASIEERAALAKLLRDMLDRPGVTGRVTIQLGQGGVTDVVLTEVSRTE